MFKLLNDSEYLLYVTITNYISVLGGVLLWASFFLLGLIARRLEQAFDRPTRWRLLLWGPSGILLYTTYTVVQAGGPSLGTRSQFILEQGIAYGALAVSGCLCLVGCASTFFLLRKLAHEAPQTPAAGSKGGEL